MAQLNCPTQANAGLEWGWLAHPFYACITLTEAAPPFAVFKGWGSLS